MSRTAYRLFSSSARSYTRANLNTAARLSRVALSRRMMSSESHAIHGNTSSDKPWIIGSALVFGSLFLYLVSPSARKGSHGHTGHEHKSHRDEHADTHVQHVESRHKEDVKPIADDEGTKVTGQEVKESMEKALEADAPKVAQEQEEVVAKAETTAIEEISATVAHLQGESTDTMPITELEPNVTPATPIAMDEATDATSDENAQGTASDATEPTVQATA